MRFQQDSSPAPYLNRRDQYRMLGLLGMLMIIVLAIDFTRKPENWNWFFAVGQTEELELKELSLDDLDFRIPEKAELPADTFIAVADTESKLDIQELGLDIGQIPPELLEEVADKRVGLLRAEQAAMDRVLKRVRTFAQPELENAAKEDVGFRVVFTDPDLHRGTLLGMQATIWRLQEFPFGDPESAEDDLWQAWFFTDDSGNNPWVVFLTEKPEGIEIGEGINRSVTVAGYFFKNYGYATEEGLHIAPMLIGKTLSVQPIPIVSNENVESVSGYVFLFLVSIIALFGLMIWWFVRSDRKFEQSHLAEIANARHDITPEFAASLSDAPPRDPGVLEFPPPANNEAPQ